MDKKGISITSVIASIVILALGTTLAYALINRPIVDYTLEPQDKIYLQPEDRKATITVKTMNRGKTDAPFDIHLSCENAKFLKNKPILRVKDNGREAFYYIRSPKNRSSYSRWHFTYRVENGVNNFYIEASVVKRLDGSWSGIINYIFGEINGYYPTKIRYSKIDELEYSKVENY